MNPSFATLKDGDELPPLVLRPGLDQVIRYSALGWAFVPLFFDEAAAKAQGMPGRIVPGPLKLSFLYRAVEGWLDGAGYVRQVRAAHRRPDLQDHEITVTGHVARVYEEDGRKRADLELAIVNDEGQPSVRGFAVVEFF
ncbi:MAG: MaoC family dehydratase [Dehalococcoidia bacterium]